MEHSKSYLDGYKAILLNNAGLVAAVENFLVGVSWLVPDRFSRSQLVGEGINAAVGSL